MGRNQAPDFLGAVMQSCLHLNDVHALCPSTRADQVQNRARPEAWPHGYCLQVVKEGPPLGDLRRRFEAVGISSAPYPAGPRQRLPTAASARIGALPEGVPAGEAADPGATVAGDGAASSTYGSF
jgi:hypothetical protein